MVPAVAKSLIPYNSTTNATFTLHTAMANQATAETVCNREGGHLASFQSLKEQVGPDPLFRAHAPAAAACATQVNRCRGQLDESCSELELAPAAVLPNAGRGGKLLHRAAGTAAGLPPALLDGPAV